ncbi:MAG: sigma 54-interacting transcriptional regulator [Acidobacteriota bacterium]
MSLRLVVKLDDETLRLPVRAGNNVLGSEEHCDLQVQHPSVSRVHALLRPDGDLLHVEDLDSRNGTYLNDERITRGRMTCADRLVLGTVTAALESIPEADLVPAVAIAGAAVGAPGSADAHAADAFARDHLPRLLALLHAGASAGRVASDAGAALRAILPCSSLEIRRRTPAGEGVLYAAQREGGPSGAHVAAASGAIEVQAAFPAADVAESFRPILDATAMIVALADLLLQGETILRRAAPASPQVALPQPPSIVLPVQKLYEEAERIAAGDVNVLVRGEPGTGKEVLARYIHAASERREAPFVKVSCAGLDAGAQAAELFGIEKPAPHAPPRTGKMERADRGTLFLDAVDALDPDVQTHLHRAIREGEIYRVGGAAPHKARVRVIAATQRDLVWMMGADLFRRDLHQVLAVHTFLVPPLRDRRDDVANLAAYFLAREAVRRSKRVAGLSQGAVAALAAYGWPGNVRELEEEIARAVLLLDDGELLDSVRLKPEIRERR